MFSIGTVFSFSENDALWTGVVLSSKDNNGAYGVMLLHSATSDTPENLRLDKNGVVPKPSTMSDDLRVDPWNTRRLAEADVAKGVGDSPLRLSRENMDKLYRALGKFAARGHYDTVHAPGPFVPGESSVPVSGKRWGAEEMESLTDASLDFWLTTGRFNDAFEA